MRDRVGRHSNAELHLLQRFLVAGDDAGRNCRRRLMMPVWHSLQAGKAVLYQVSELLVIQVPGSGDDDVIGAEPPVIMGQQVFLLERANRFLGAQDWLAQRMVLPEILG